MSHTISKHRLMATAAASVIGLSLGAAAPAYAQTAAKDTGYSQLDEIVVTARRREETLQTTPISITALTAQSLEQRNVDDVTKLSQVVPNLNLLSSTAFGASRTAFAFIRGVGQTEVFVQNDPGVGIYVDGVYIGRSQGSVFDVLDLARVEVLRGPQGTLYGRNTIGGAINLISTPPSAEQSFTVQAEVGNYNTVNASLKANLPISEKVLSSVALSRRSHDGYSEAKFDPICPNCSQTDIEDEDSWAGRVAVRLLPNESLTIDLTADYSKKDDLPLGTRTLFFKEGLFPQYDNAVRVAWAGRGPGSFVNTTPNTHQSSFTGADKQEVWGVSATVAWTSDKTTLKSITGYRELDLYHASDSDGAPLALNTIIPQETTQNQFSQEFQLLSSAFDNRLDYILGVYGMKEDAFDSINQGQSFGELAFLPPFAPPRFLPFPQFVPATCFNRNAPPLYGCGRRGAETTDYKVRSYAAFGNATWHLTDRLSISGGLRYNYEAKDFLFISPAFGGSFFDLSADWDSLTPRIGVEFKATADMLLYASYSEGFKSGTFNNGNDPTQPLDVRPEKVKAYEVGAKTSWWDNRLTFNIAAFYSDYTNQQLQVQTNVLTQSRAFVNVGGSEIYGAEIEVVARPTEYLRLDAGLGYTHTEITKINVGTPNVKLGAKLVHTPEISVNLGGDWTVPISEMGSLILRADWSYKSEQEGDFTNNRNVRVDSFNVTNLRATFTPTSGRWDIYAFGDNVFDEEYELSRASFDPNNFASAVDGAPRTYGAGLKVRF